MPKHAHRGYHGRFAKADTLDSARAREGVESVLRRVVEHEWSILERQGLVPGSVTLAEHKAIVAARARRQALLDQAVRNHSQNYGAYAEAWLTHAAALLSGASWGRGNAANDIIAIRAEFARLAAANEQPRP